MNIQINEQRLMQQFTRLVEIDSETGQEAGIAVYLQQLFTQLGLHVTEDNAAEITGFGANNLICTLAANVDGVEPIFFTSHMDTVKPGIGISPQLIDDYFVSDGTTILGADDKAGIAVMVEAIQLLQENELPHGQIQFVITVGEESGLVGARAIDQTLLDARFGYALDSDGNVGEFVVQAPYQAKIFAEIRGKSAHAGINPEKGISAINVASKAISKMKLGRIDAETTANIGSFQGGTQTNIVCDFVAINAEARSLQANKLYETTKRIKQTFEDVALEYGATVDVTIEQMYDGYHYGTDDKVVQVAMKAAEKLHLPLKLLKSNGGSDANIFNSYGIPTVNLAVGYEFIHTKKERIHVHNLFNLTQFVLKIIEPTTNDTL